MSSGPYSSVSYTDRGHIGKPSRLERSVLFGDRGRRDHRTYARRRLECDLWLIDGEAQAVLRCKTDNVSDAGLHVVAPLGFGLAVGQRFEVRMAAPHNSGPMSSNSADSLGYATVIRTQIKVGDHTPDRVGAALCFDVPQLVPV